MRRTVLPAEWAPQAAVLLTWPRKDGDFSETYPAVENNFIEIARTVTRFEPVWISCESGLETLQQRLLKAGVRPDRFRIFPVPSDDVWARDHGPITVLRNGAPVHLDFTFNGWGGKYAAGHDNRITRRLAEGGVWSAPVETVDFVLEGGGIESDGAGTLLTTERCLLTPTRNPQFDRSQIEEKLKDWFGVQRVLWLRHGGLAGDDTDGHIDTLARFCDPQTIAYQACENRDDAQYRELHAMEAELKAFRRLDGTPYRLIPLPLPGAIHDVGGHQLPAGYANFLIVNDAVLVPTYGDPMDGVALERLRAVFPKREIVGIDCRALIAQYGSLHCVTMQIPQTP
ncbi:MAG: agmatine deiminase family protein [Nevskiales bacterium]|nr:agmatine deiminase family protein [Nevskiales bacterium]